MLVGYESRKLYNIGKNSYYHQGVPGLECRTGARLVSPAKGGAKKIWTLSNRSSKCRFEGFRVVSAIVKLKSRNSNHE